MASIRQNETEWVRSFRRCLLIGAPDSWKSSSFTTWPGPRAIFQCPGELGGSTLQESPEQTIWTYRKEGKETEKDLVQQFRKDVDLAVGSGKYQAVFLDGLSALYGTIFKMHEAEGGDKRSWFWMSETVLFEIIGEVLNSNTPYVCMTVWPAPQEDDPIQAEMAAKTGGVVSKHFMPDIPGKNAPARLLGKFGVKANCKPGQQVAPGKFSSGKWILRNQGTSYGAGMKLPISIAERIPTEVEANWTKLEAMVMGGVK